MKRVICLLLCALVLLSCFSACETEPEEDPSGPVTLTVVTEEVEGPFGLSDHFTNALYSALGYFRMNHKEIKIDLEILPTAKNERKIRLQKLRTDLMAGEGPDVFLLPSGMIRGERGLREPLFANVEMAMRNLYFADLSDYYDADEDLKKEELQQDVMNAGVLDGARYVLPLGFNMPVICYDPTKLGNSGLTEEDLHAPLGELLDTALKSGNLYTERFAALFPAPTLCLFQPIFDFDTERLLLDRETLYAISGQKRQLKAEGGGSDWPSGHTMELSGYMDGRFNYLLQSKNVAFYFEELTDAAGALGMGKTNGVDVKVTPMRTVGGEVAAEVTYFGAVNANCEHPAQAYEFLRTFLSAGVQHQTGLGAASTRLIFSDTAWPVRVAGSVETKWSAKKSENTHSNTDKKRRLALGETHLSDDDLPLLFEKIDVVQFRLPILQNDENGVWVERTAEGLDEVLEQLEYHIAEG